MVRQFHSWTRAQNGVLGTQHGTPLASPLRSARVDRDGLSTKRTDDQDLLRELRVPSQVPEGRTGRLVKRFVHKVV